MRVSDKQAATLRAQLAGDLEQAVRRRFGASGTPDDVIAFVAEVRTRSERARDALDAQIAERMLLAAIDGADATGLDSREARSSQRFLLAAMVADKQFDDADLDKFIARARAAADKLLLASLLPDPCLLGRAHAPPKPAGTAPLVIIHGKDVADLRG